MIKYGPLGMTAHWQPVDASIGKVLNDNIRDSLKVWLGTARNRRAWNRKGGMTLPTRWMCLKWTGSSWAEIHDMAKYKHAWRATGCALSANGAGGASVAPQGMFDYAPPAP